MELSGLFSNRHRTPGHILSCSPGKQDRIVPFQTHSDPYTSANQYCRSRTEFQKSIHLDKKDFGAIEYLLRKGQRQLEMYSAPGIRDIH